MPPSSERPPLSQNHDPDPYAVNGDERNRLAYEAWVEANDPGPVGQQPGAAEWNIALAEGQGVPETEASSGWEQLKSLWDRLAEIKEDILHGGGSDETDDAVTEAFNIFENALPSEVRPGGSVIVATVAALAMDAGMTKNPELRKLKIRNLQNELGLAYSQDRDSEGGDKAVLGDIFGKLEALSEGGTSPGERQQLYENMQTIAIENLPNADAHPEAAPALLAGYCFAVANLPKRPNEEEFEKLFDTAQRSYSTQEAA